MGEFSGWLSRGRHVANYDVSIGPDASENGGDPEGRVQDSTAGVLANLQRGGNPRVLSWLHRYDPRRYPICRVQLLHVRHVEKLIDW